MRAGTNAVILLIFTICIASVGTGAMDVSDDEALIRNLDADWSHALETKNLDKVMSFYADEAVFLAPGGAVIKDRVQLKQHVANLMSLPGYALNFSPTTIRVSKSRDMAYDISIFHLTFSDERGNKTTREGKALTIWAKRAGQWKVTVEAPNYDN
jgi:uncharacterized protein (TIGR02246 family)